MSGTNQGKATKRSRERLIQGWFDPESPEDAAVLAIHDRLASEYEAKQKQMIAYGILALGQQYFPDFVASLPTTDTQARDQMRAYTEKLFAGIDRLLEVIESGQSLASNEGRAAVDSIRQSRQEAEHLDSIQESIAGRYVGMRFDDEDSE